MPLVWDKNLIYRPETATNVIFSQASGHVHCAPIGVK